MKLFPRHIKVLKTLVQYKLGCTQFLGEKSAVRIVAQVLSDLNKEGLVAFGMRKYGQVWMKGWVLTEEGEIRSRNLFPALMEPKTKEAA